MAWVIVPLALLRVVVIITKDRTDVGSSPCDADAGLITSLSISCYRRAETLAVSSRVAGTRVSHTVFIKRNRIDLFVALVECLSSYNAAHHFSPVISMGFCFAGAVIGLHIWTGGMQFPAVGKF